MYCNHRSRRKPGACAKCWRLGIIIWSVMYVSMIGMMFYSDKKIDMLGVLLLVVPAILILTSLSKWNKGD